MANLTGALAAAAALLSMAWAAPAMGAEVAGTIVSVKGTVLLRDGSKDKPAEPKRLAVGDKVYEGQVINTASDAAAKILLADKSIVDVGPTTLFNVEKFKVGNSIESRQATFGMEYGSVRALVTKNLGPMGNFRVKTRTATMGVRGTEFVVMSDLVGLPKVQNEGEKPKENESHPAGGTTKAPQMKVVVLEGKVEVSGKAFENSEKKDVLLTEGKKFTAEVEPDKKEEKQAKDANEGQPPEEKAKPEPPKVEEATKEEVKEVKEVAKVEDNTFKKEITIDKSLSGSNAGCGSMCIISESMPKDFQIPNIDALPPNTIYPSFAGIVGRNVHLSVTFHHNPPL